jgi:hypothetical protein
MSTTTSASRVRAALSSTWLRLTARSLVGLGVLIAVVAQVDRLNPQLQEKVIPMKSGRGHWRFKKARTHAKGKAATARIRSARAYTK